MLEDGCLAVPLDFRRVTAARFNACFVLAENEYYSQLSV
jgi:hypothetical protein